MLERFGAAGIAPGKVSFFKESYVFNFDGAPAGFASALGNYYGPTMNAFEAAAKSGKLGDLEREFTALVESQNQSSKRDRTSVPATYLRVTVSV